MPFITTGQILRKGHFNWRNLGLIDENSALNASGEIKSSPYIFLFAFSSSLKTRIKMLLLFYIVKRLSDLFRHLCRREPVRNF